MTGPPVRVVLLLASLAVAASVAMGCAPRLSPLVGAPAPAVLPSAQVAVPGRHAQMVFDWDLDDRELSARGQGAARIAVPDSVRLDFFLSGGFGSGGAGVLIDDSLRTPQSDMLSRLVPPPPLLWGALGRAAVPALSDTTVRVDGSVLRADIGRPVAWRLTYDRDTLRRVERVSDGRVVEWVDRSDGVHIVYRNEGARRALRLTVQRLFEVPPFDVSIWQFDR